jgi:hypothetical protein
MLLRARWRGKEGSVVTRIKAQVKAGVDFDEKCRVRVSYALDERGVADSTFRTSNARDVDVYCSFWLASAGTAEGVSAHKQAGSKVCLLEKGSVLI